MLARLIILLTTLLVSLPGATVADTAVHTASVKPVLLPEVIIEYNEPEYIEEELLYDELEYLAACVEAEAGNQGLLGKRYVTDVILNRVDSDKFPDTITEVINAPRQFSVVSDGRIDKVIPTEETYQAVQLELENRLDDTILFFRTEHYHTGYTPCFKHEDHYFSK